MGIDIAYTCMRMVLSCTSIARRQTQSTPSPSWNAALLSQTIMMTASNLKMNSVKSEVIWVGCRRTVSTHGCPAIRIGNDTICATNKARLLSVLISADWTFDQHVTSVSGQYFYQLRRRQLRTVRQSLDTESTTTLIRAFVSSRVDYCCSLLIGFSHRQASARPQCSCPCYNQHQEVWKRVITDTASQPSLAGCS